MCDRQERLGNRIVMANGGAWGFGEFLRQIMMGLGIDFKAFQPSTMIRLIQNQIRTLRDDGKQVVIAVDESDKLRNDVFQQLHLLVSSPDSGEALAPLVLSGQESLADKLVNPLATPLRSRMYPGYYVSAINRQTYRSYVQHHMDLCGMRADVVDDLALEHIWKASSGNLRSIGMNFRIAIQYAANHDLPRLDAASLKVAFTDWWSIAQTGAETPGLMR